MLIKEYQKGWVNDFNAIKAVIKSNLQTINIEIEHVGSTSIEKLAAKPIIDIDIIYFNQAAFDPLRKGLEQLGYYHNGNQGIKGREVFKRQELKRSHQILDTIKHHLYVCPISSEELKRHLIFRDFLRAHEKDRIKYEKLKYSIAEKANQDRKEYAKLKEVMARAFVESIIERAHNK